jgi:peptide/nickel transport system permease protein
VWSKTSRGAALALVCVTAASFLLPQFAQHDPLTIALAERLAPPGPAHWLGTDELGRDVLSRILHGAALTVGVSVAALVSALVLGIALGSAAGYFYRRWPDAVFVWCADFLSSIPFLLVMAAVLSLGEPGLKNAYLVLTAVMWVSPARIVRAEVIKTLPLDYVMAERALGKREVATLFLTVMPACVDAAILFCVGYFPEIIALEAGLSFLGLGVQPPQPGLGKMIYEGIGFIGSAWWLAVAPAATLFAIVLGVQGIMLYVGRRPMTDQTHG